MKKLMQISFKIDEDSALAWYILTRMRQVPADSKRKGTTHMYSRAAIIKGMLDQIVRSETFGCGERRYRHLKRGSVVSVHGEYKLQASRPVTEGTMLVAYSHEAEGTNWVRPVSEFYDGRFEGLQDEK